MNETFFVCDVCGTRHPRETMRQLDDSLLCPTCVRTHTMTCSCCGHLIWLDDNAGDDITPLCHDCQEYHYVRCTRCHSVVHNEDAHYRGDDEDEDYPYCSDCYHNFGAHGIMDYYYKPSPIFYGKGPRYFGVELEIDGAGEYDSNASALLKIANAHHDHIYCKHDGSLDEGFEIVTHPMTLDYHMTQMPWLEVVNKAVSLGYSSHQAGTCGLHIHVSRKAFGATEGQQEAGIARILYFVERNWAELLRFSRRTQRQLDQWAARYGYKDQPREILDHVKKGCHAGRYSCVNLEPYHTIEFRIFRGTLKYNTIIATLQLVNLICDVAIFMSDDQLKALSWSDFVAGIDRKKYPELVRYLKERRLYVNAPVTEEEEI